MRDTGSLSGNRLSGVSRHAHPSSLPSCAPTDSLTMPPRFPIRQQYRTDVESGVFFSPELTTYIPQFDLAHWGISKSRTTPDPIRISGSRGCPWLNRRVLGLDGEIAAIPRD